MQGNRELTDIEIAWLIRKWDHERECKSRLRKLTTPMSPVLASPIAIVKELVPSGVYAVSTTSKWALSEKRVITPEGIERRTYSGKDV